jgi:hypothetical protein
MGINTGVGMGMNLGSTGNWHGQTLGFGISPPLYHDNVSNEAFRQDSGPALGLFYTLPTPHMKRKPPNTT